MKTIFILLIMFMAVQARSLEEQQALIDSLNQEIQYNKAVLAYDSSVAPKISIDSVRVVVASEKLKEMVRDEDDHHYWWVWVVGFVTLGVTVMGTMSLSGI